MTRFQHGQHWQHGALNNIDQNNTSITAHWNCFFFNQAKCKANIWGLQVSALTPLRKIIYGLHFAGGTNINVNDLFSQFKLCFSSVKVFGGSDTWEMALQSRGQISVRNEWMGNKSIFIIFNWKSMENIFLKIVTTFKALESN